jgi:hypothetical protein
MCVKCDKTEEWLRPQRADGNGAKVVRDVPPDCDECNHHPWHIITETGNRLILQSAKRLANEALIPVLWWRLMLWDVDEC